MTDLLKDLHVSEENRGLLRAKVMGQFYLIVV
jgi:hypothetical protein